MSLIGIGEIKFEQWAKGGLPGPNEADGRFTLPEVIRWREKLYAAELSKILKPDRLSQKKLAELLGVTRETIAAWGLSGLPRRDDRHYDFSAVCQWLRSYYIAVADKRYERRLSACRRKICRNIRQIERFLSDEKNKS
jgi:hypothetical protein